MRKARHSTLKSDLVKYSKFTEFASTLSWVSENTVIRKLSISSELKTMLAIQVIQMTPIIQGAISSSYWSSHSLYAGV